MTDQDARKQNDIGGLELGERIDRGEHRLSLSERRIDAMMNLLFAPGRRIFNIDEMRLAIENLPTESYRRYNYYERWMLAMEQLLLRKGLLTKDEIAAKIVVVRRRLSQSGVMS
jgi:hypothetical protein